MKKPQEAAPEAEAQRHRALRLIGQGSVVELELFQGIPQLRIFGSVGRIHAGEHHGLHFLIALEGFRRRILRPGDGIAHPGVGNGLDGGGEIANLACAQCVSGFHALGMEIAHLHHLIDRAAGHHLYVHALGNYAVHDTEIDNHALITVILAVENQRAQGLCPVAGGSGQILDDHLQHRADVDAVFCGNLRGILRRQANNVLDLLLHPLGIRSGQVDFIDDRQNLQPRVDGKIGVGKGLGLYTLGCVHHQYRALAGCQRTGHLIVKVHVPRGVDEVQDIGLPVVRRIFQPNRPGLNGNAPLPLQIHVVQDLILHLPGLYGLAFLQQPVGQGGLSVVNMGNDRKIPQFIQIGHTMHLKRLLERP